MSRPRPISSAPAALKSRLDFLESAFSKIHQGEFDQDDAQRFVAQFEHRMGIDTVDLALLGEEFLTGESDGMLTKRLIDPIVLHPKQRAVWDSLARFIVIPAGRRSGKTELAKRELVKAACSEVQYDDAWFVAAAPTHTQAKRIYWNHLKRMIPSELKRGEPSESELTIWLKSGVEITVMGMDQPARIEGKPLNGVVLDEYGNMKKEVLDEHVLPMLAERNAWMWLIGAPEGRNHYFNTYQDAVRDTTGTWAGFTWKTSEVLPLYLGAERAAQEVAIALQKMDLLTFQQEYDASFVVFAGQAYHCWDEAVHVPKALPTEYQYHPLMDLVLCFDFNVSPGTATIIQERVDKTIILGEVHIPRNSTTPAVCRKIAQVWGNHKGRVACYGDATGGAQGSAKVAGSDWDIIKKELGSVFGDRLRFKVDHDNPRERVRVNAVNSRLKSADGAVHLLVNGKACPNVIKDFEGVRLLEGGSGEIDKKHDESLTHLTDGLGYYIAKEFPIQGKHVTSFEQR